MKTAIQELMDIVEMDYYNGVEISMKVFNNMLKEALVKEKAQIKTAWLAGAETCCADYKLPETDEDYYTETFTQIEPNF